MTHWNIERIVALFVIAYAWNCLPFKPDWIKPAGNALIIILAIVFVFCL